MSEADGQQKEIERLTERKARLGSGIASGWLGVIIAVAGIGYDKYRFHAHDASLFSGALSIFWGCLAIFAFLIVLGWIMRTSVIRRLGSLNAADTPRPSWSVASPAFPDMRDQSAGPSLAQLRKKRTTFRRYRYIFLALSVGLAAVIIIGWKTTGAKHDGLIGFAFFDGFVLLAALAFVWQQEGNIRRKIADYGEKSAPGATHQIVSVVQLLISDSEAERESAQQTIQAMGPEDVKLLLRLFYYEEPCERRVHKRRYWAFFAGFLLAGCLLGQWIAASVGTPPEILDSLAPGIFFGCLGFFAAFKINSRQRDRQRESIFGREIGSWPLMDRQNGRWVAQALVQAGNPALLPILLNGRRSCWWFIDLTPAVTTLLDRLGKDEAAVLDTPHRAYLYSSLRMRYADLADDRVSYLLAILRFAGRVGDPMALPTVRRLANSRAKTPNQQRVKEAARDCLMRIEGSSS